MRLVRGLSLGLLFGWFIACDERFPIETPTVIASEGAHVEIRLRPFSLQLYDHNGALVAKTLAGSDPADPNGGPAATLDSGADGVGAIPGWDGYYPNEGSWDHGGEAELLSNDDAHASLSLRTDNGHFDITIAVEGSKISIHQEAVGHLAGDPNATWNKTSMTWALRDDDHFFGLGERYATMDHRGWALYSWAEEGGVSHGEDVPPRSTPPLNPDPNGPSMTYFPVPFVLTPQGWALHLNTTRRTETIFGSERNDAWRVAVNGTALDMVFYANDDPMKSISDFTGDTGRPNVPAPWVFGPRRRVSLGQQVDGVDEWKLLRTRGVPTTTLDDATHFLPHSSQIGREAQLSAWTSLLHQNGYNITAYNTPYVSQSDPMSAEIYQYGLSHGYYLMDPAKNAPGTTYFISGELQTVVSIDLTNPAAVAWYQDLLRRTLALGYDGWMNDFGEYTRRGWVASDGTTGEALHNLFPVLSAKAAHELLEKERPNDYLFYVRSGYTGSNQYASTAWGGDAEATFDQVQGLPSMVRGGLNLGMSGFPLWGSDTSGYKCLTNAPRDKDVYLRWTEFSAVSPIMEEENACSNPLDPNASKWKLWNDDETVNVVGAMQRLHTRLQPYFMVLATEAHATGAPIMRHPMLLFPHEPASWQVEDAFFVGASLFAAPVVKRARITKDVWFPPGRYVALDSSAVFEGPKVTTIDAPLDSLPLFVVENQMVPLLDPTIDTLVPAPAPDVVSPDKVADRLDVIVALGAGGHAEMTLTDGTKLTADRGAAAPMPDKLATVTADQISSCASCTITTSEGGVSRLRINTAVAPATNVSFDDVKLSATGMPARRIRWDVRRLP